MTRKLTVDPALSVGIVAPAPLCKAVNIAAGVPTGHVAVPVVVQLAVVQLRPVATGSLATALGAFPGPKFDTVTV